jgi:hypothetical protein
MHMLRYRVLIAFVLLAACGRTGGNTTAASGASGAPPSAPAESTASVAQAFGLIGRWALNCGQAPSQDNEYAIYAAPGDGTVSLSYDDGPDVVPNRYSYTAAQLVGADQIQLDGVFVRDGQAQHPTLRKNPQGQIKVWRNVDGSGRVLVDNGAFPSGGGPAWESKCSG